MRQRFETSTLKIARSRLSIRVFYTLFNGKFQPIPTVQRNRVWRERGRPSLARDISNRS